MHPHLAGYMTEVAGLSRRLARTLFHQMVRHGVKLEKRQVQLARIADIGADLFALAATCVYAQKLLQDGEPAAKVFMLGDDFHVQARQRIDRNFHDIGHNADDHGYTLAQQVINGEHQWVERGIV